ncbi:MAG: hypothetical protein WC325_06665 [Candidatus Bathyarchaeia archaeon]
MGEEKKRQTKVTVDTDISPSLRDIVAECVQNIPEMAQKVSEHLKKRK